MSLSGNRRRSDEVYGIKISGWLNWNDPNRTVAPGQMSSRPRARGAGTSTGGARPGATRRKAGGIWREPARMGLGSRPHMPELGQKPHLLAMALLAPPLRTLWRQATVR